MPELKKVTANVYLPFELVGSAKFLRFRILGVP